MLVNRVILLAVSLMLVLVPPRGGAAPPDSAPAGEALERTVLDAVNDARRAQKLPPLVPDPALAEVARRHSCDMATRGFFSHTTPDGLTMGDRLKAAGQRYASAGENVAKIEARDPAARAVAGWLKSPGHRDNMLSARFTRTGVGACRAGRAVYFTQLFVRPP